MKIKTKFKFKIKDFTPFSGYFLCSNAPISLHPSNVIYTRKFCHQLAIIIVHLSLQNKEKKKDSFKQTKNCSFTLKSAQTFFSRT
jgi:hypothetical protein